MPEQTPGRAWQGDAKRSEESQARGEDRSLLGKSEEPVTPPGASPAVLHRSANQFLRDAQRSDNSTVPLI